MASMAKIKHVYGNVLKVAIPLTKVVLTLVDGVETKEQSDFFPNENYPVIVRLKGRGTIRYDYTADVQGNVVSIIDRGEVRVGTYSVEVLAYDENNDKVRYKVKTIIDVVDATIDAGIEAGIEFEAQTHILDGAVFFYAKGDKGDTGVGIASVIQTQQSLVSDGVNIITVTLTDGRHSSFQVRNGSKPTIVVENEILKFR